MTEQKTIKIEAQQRALSIAPNSFNEADNTIEVIFGSETPVRMYNYHLDGYFNEVLDMKPESVRQDRFDSMPVLDNHSRWGGTNDVLGRVESIRFENGLGYAKLKLTSREDRKGFIQDVKDGILRGISVGYQVNQYQLEKIATDTELATYRAIDWMPYEISFAPVQADPKSKVRSQEETTLHECIITSEVDENKTESNNNPTTPTMDVNDNKDVAQPPVTTPVDTTAERNAIIEQERKRTLEISSLARKFNLGQEFEVTAIEQGLTPEQASVRALNILEERNKQTTPQGGGETKVGQNGAERMAKDLEDGLSFRADRTLQVSDSAKQLGNLSLIRMAENFLQAGGIGTNSLSNEAIARRTMGTTDFTNILANVMNKSLQRAYDQAERTYLPLVSSTTTSDFKALTSTALSALPNFEKVEEGAEYGAAALNDSKEVYSIAKYGNMMTFSWESIINDDLRAFSRVPTLQANAWANTQSNIVWGIITANANMGDGNALFSSAHGNLAGTGAAISIATLAAAKKAMRNQKAAAKLNSTQTNENYLNLIPVFLVVGPDSELAAQQILAPITANLQANVNPNSSLQLIVEPRLTGNQWYVFASPNRIDTIETCSLAGNDFYTEQQYSFDEDALKYKVRATFGAKALDWRGMYKNAGGA